MRKLKNETEVNHAGLEGHVRVPRVLKFSRIYDFFVLIPAFLLLSQEPISLTLLSSFLQKNGKTCLRVP